MFKLFVLLALIVAVCSIPTPPIQVAAEADPNQVAAEGARGQANPAVDASVRAANGEIDPKNEEEELEGAEFGWGWKKWGWGYPSYRSYYTYPSYYYPSYYYQSYQPYWW